MADLSCVRRAGGGAGSGGGFASGLHGLRAADASGDGRAEMLHRTLQGLQQSRQQTCSLEVFIS